MLHNIEDRTLAQSQPMADFSPGLSFADELEYFGRKAIRLDALG
jgi:hypothetical protein